MTSPAPDQPDNGYRQTGYEPTWTAPATPLSRPLGFATGALALFSLAWSVLWAVATLLSDRTEFLQYIAYVPSPLYAGSALLAGVAAGLAALLHSAPARAAGSPRPRHRLARLALGLAALASAVVLVRDLRVLNALGGQRQPGPQSITLVHWNTGSLWRDHWPEARSAIPLLPRTPDIVLISNPPQPSGLPGFADLVRASNQPGQAPADSSAAEVRVLPGGFVIATRWPVLASGGFGLDLPPPRVEHFPTFLPANSWLGRLAKRMLPLRISRYAESGDVAFVRLDTTPRLGKPITIWLIDLPSDPRLPRAMVAERVERRLRELASAGALPPPDMVVGDFNIPRGTWSLAHILSAGGPLAHAFDQASWGLAASWPRERPALHIDHVLLAPWLRATRYELRDPGLSDHFLQAADIQPAP